MAKNWVQDNLFNLLTILIVVAGTVYNYGVLSTRVDQQCKEIEALIVVVKQDHDTLIAHVAKGESEKERN